MLSFTCQVLPTGRVVIVIIVLYLTHVDLCMSNKRQKLEEAATNAVQRSGLHNLSFRTLADEVGVKSSSVHYYFPEKSHLACALIENYTQAFNEQLSNISDRKINLRKKLDALVKIFDDVVKAEKFCLCGMMAAEVAILSEENKKHLSNYFKQAEDWLFTLLSDNADQVTSDIKPRVLARIFISGLEGAILLDRVDGGRNRLRAQHELIRSLIQ